MHNKFCLSVATLCLALVFSVGVYAGGVNSKDEDGKEKDWVPTGKGTGSANANGPSRWKEGSPSSSASRRPVQGSNGINYHNGSVMGGTTNVYYIWYGNWANNATAKTILTDLVGGLSGSPYYNINTTYSTASNKIANSVSFRGATNDNYSQGTTLSDAGVANVVANAINSGTVPKDVNGVYFVLTSADVNESSGFCTSYCGWHSHATIAATDIKYSFVGNPDRCPSSCGAANAGPNGNNGADAMASILVHELEETVTNPASGGWWDSRGAENADKCSWTYGATYKTGTGATANMKLGSRDYLIQQNWVNATRTNTNGSTTYGYCAKSY